MLGARGQIPSCNHTDTVGMCLCHFPGYPLPFILEFAVAQEHPSAKIDACQHKLRSACVGSLWRLRTRQKRACACSTRLISMQRSVSYADTFFQANTIEEPDVKSAHIDVQKTITSKARLTVHNEQWSINYSATLHL